MGSETTCDQCGEEMVMLCLVCLDAEKPTPPAPAMPDEVRALVDYCLAGSPDETDLVHLRIRKLAAAVEAKYGGSR